MPLGKADELADNKRVNADADAADKFGGPQYDVLARKTGKFALNQKQPIV
jgi:hypothetical protein